MNAGGYTYARIDCGGSSVWLAGPETKLATGTAMGRMTGSLMTGFHSDTLNRTFDKIYFVNQWGTVAPPNPHAGGKITAPAAAPPPTEKIAPAPGGKTVAEVFGAKSALAGKQVAVRGKVVKVNNGILGRNWVHLQDGTGAAGTNDLLITTQATVQLGDIVVVHGTVATNKDFGAGYRYDVLLENSTLAGK